ncbi:glycosyltransferase [Methylobacterium dankookense]|uniref:N-acetylglucosaminyl-diphospho-decaprenol L-rhamnosyltransferase n=1 Tax=Methylobacterium dankookense TaxID=560405 RepID=A0A564G7R5_9HYPH|nr:glycosyltransferase [Methylobacterium dankookense]GJD59046.1 hypothetical protein IFDJLNFL_4972 [Methylobacterium dankookense]VUF15860.1 N-acetylglucosaminyl-diphospho-decaprenol L-rhamnosyltransferase [Methylobacterium dankookense]
MSPETIDPHYGRLAALVEAQLIENALARNALRIAFTPVSDPLVSVVIVSRNAHLMLGLTLYRLASLQALAGATFEVILVDNGSHSETQSVLDRVDGATLIRNEENAGFGPACNAGSNLARGRYLLFLNPDVELMPGAIGALVEPFADSSVGIVGAHLVFPGGILQECGAFFRNDAQLTHAYGRGNANPLLPEGTFQRQVSYVSGAVLMIERDLFIELDGFDDIYKPAYFEDTDLCVRCHQKGRRVIYQPRATAIHFENATSRQRSDVEFLIDRNRKIFLDRHRSWLFPDPSVRPRFGDREHDNWALRVLYIDDAVPHHDLGSGLPRANFIIKAMDSLGYRVTVYPVHRADSNIYDRYRDLPDTVEILNPGSAVGLSSLFDERRDHYDTMWVSRPHNIDLACQVAQDKGFSLRDIVRKRVIFDSEALFCLRDFIEKALRDGQIAAPSFKQSALRETRNFAQADHVVCVSPAEASILNNFGITNVTILGHAFDLPEIQETCFADRSGLLFIGSLVDQMSPNIDSLGWFLDSVWPIVRNQLPEVRMRIVGQITSEFRRRFTRPGVEVLGRVSNLTPLLANARISVAPTRYAAGVPHKVHMSVAHGLPCLVTPILAEQIGWPKDAGYHVCDWRDPKAFADALLRLYSEADVWADLQRAGRLQVDQECNPAAFAAVLRTLCERPVFA